MEMILEWVKERVELPGMCDFTSPDVINVKL